MLNFIAFVLIFMILYRFFKSNQALKQKVEHLEKQLFDLRHQLFVFTQKSSEQVAEEDVENQVEENEIHDEAEEISTEEAEEISTEEAEEINTEEVEEKKQEIEEAPIVLPKQEEPVPKQKSRTRTEWEMLIAGKWLNWIGAVALFLGVAFFMKYAFDNNWINEYMRVAIGAVFGFILLFVGARFAKRDLVIFSQGLAGAGIAVLYTAVFAAYNFYSLVPQLTAIILMLVVTILCFQQALLYQSLAVALLGWIGAFGTPFLLAGEGSSVGLLSYLCFIVIGMLALVWKKKQWTILYYLSFFVTYLIYFGVHWVSIEKEISYSLLFLFAYWFLFYLFDLRFLFGEKAKKRERIVGIVNAIALTYGVVLHLTSSQAGKTVISLSVFAIGLLYLIPIIVFYLQRRLLRANQWQLARQSITFLLLSITATYLYFDFLPFVFVTCIEVGAILWWGLRFQISYIERFALGVLSILSLTVFVVTLLALQESRPILNWVFADNLACVLVLFFGAHGYHRNGFAKIRSGLHVIWSLLLFVGIYVEIHIASVRLFHRAYGSSFTAWTSPVHLDYLTNLITLVVLVIFTLLVLLFALKRNIRKLMLTTSLLLGCTLLVFAVLGKTYPVLAFYTRVVNLRAIAFLVVLFALYGAYRVWSKIDTEHPWYKPFRLVVMLTMLLLLLEVVTVEIIDGFAKQIVQQTAMHVSAAAIENRQFYFVVLVWVFFSFFMYQVGVKLRYRLFAYIALSIFGLGTIPMLVHSFSYYTYQDFVPVANLRFLSFVCLVVVLYLWYHYMKKDQVFTAKPYMTYIRQSLFFLGVFVVFLCITLEIHAVFQAIITPLGMEKEKMIEWTNLQQLSISFAWLLLSSLFLWMGIWRKKQSLRIVSISIFGLSIVKIFFIDLQFLTTLYRIFSFMGLGVILLSVSFVYQRYKHWFSNDESKSL